jgi:hypothetical protein
MLSFAPKHIVAQEWPTVKPVSYNTVAAYAGNIEDPTEE